MTLALPRHIVDPPRILLWRDDDLPPLLLALITGVLTDHRVLLLALGAVGVRLDGR